MADTTTRPADTYSPLYFLASLGAGGLAVTFFMYLMFWVPHEGRPVPTFEDISAAFATGGLPMQTAIIVAVLGIAFFTVLNVKSLIWNFGALAAFKKTDRYAELRNSNAETTLLAAPLATAMTINAMFIVGLVFVPRLWNVIEYLFPLALIAFLGLGVWAFRTIGDFLGRVLTQGGVFDVTAHNSFAQLLPAFAISMVAVGLAAPAAMSGNTLTVGLSLVLSTFFGFAAITYTVVAAITAFNSMLHHGTARESGPTLMVIVPILTVLGIMFMRQTHGLHTSFGAEETDGETMVFLARLLTVQILFLLLGMVVLRRQGYFTDYVFGSKTSPGSYALVCPGVALSVMLQFFINKGLVAAGVIGEFGIAYWVLTGIALASQFAMIGLVLRLNRQHFGKAPQRATMPAE
ncbi:hypothetical protein M8756_13185 [Lutimaribacter sp. EGI FJ00015]|uniref:Uncharacterized protein n=1 Tax=Lutimaribacter degradans TaxID=2945989 RepID=A0ACC5ZXQ5_9RHOB|nr:hypothetical protein [Lutimaribacter sp. EGI FJ00013]MCM2563087.1 hypothetical protein [Lutimaribacter sp. EGI FJ00013]MCO0614266.1 hypothetical protein [Lutimaribacter sp. EGI FJ00015]MCO0637076.1 hypothetical protein [Lutimaribacter sp. EGI FJ00014]